MANVLLGALCTVYVPMLFLLGKNISRAKTLSRCQCKTWHKQRLMAGWNCTEGVSFPATTSHIYRWVGGTSTNLSKCIVSFARCVYHRAYWYIRKESCALRNRHFSTIFAVTRGGIYIQFRKNHFKQSLGRNVPVVIGHKTTINHDDDGDGFNLFQIWIHAVIIKIGLQSWAKLSPLNCKCTVGTKAPNPDIRKQ